MQKEFVLLDGSHSNKTKVRRRSVVNKSCRRTTGEGRGARGERARRSHDPTGRPPWNGGQGTRLSVLAVI